MYAFIYSILLFFLNPASDNTKPVTKINYSYSPAVVVQEAIARKHIRQLKNGVLLVRLHTSENTINALVKRNLTQQAAKVKADQLDENKKLYDAFKNYYTFTPVYFFYSSDSNKLLKGETQGVFLDQNLNQDPSIKLPSDNFYVVELTMPEVRNLKDKNRKEENKSGQLQNFTGLVMREKDLTQLAQPFPYFVRSYSTIPIFKRDENTMVKKLNENLQDSYKEMLNLEPNSKR